MAMAVLRIYILAGSENMKGHGSNQHLFSLAENPETASNYRQWLNPETWDWNQLTNVFCWTDSRVDNLTVGHGVHDNEFGPELGFGFDLQFQQLQEQPDNPDRYLLIKTAYPGASLARDFRPPSAGQPPYQLPGEDGSSSQSLGRRFSEMISTIFDTLLSLEALVPGYTSSEGHSIDGLLWFHGQIDLQHPDTAAEYGPNLSHFIQDVRSRLQLPALPCFIGELGMEGTRSPSEGHQTLRLVQAHIAATTANVRFVRTAPYVPEDYPTDYVGYDPLQQIGVEGYYGRADTFYQIGQAFATAVAEHMKKPDVVAITETGSLPAGVPTDMMTENNNNGSPSIAPTDYIPVLATRSPTVQTTTITDAPVPVEAPVPPPSIPPSDYIPFLATRSPTIQTTAISDAPVSVDVPVPPPSIPPSEYIPVLATRSPTIEVTTTATAAATTAAATSSPISNSAPVPQPSVPPSEYIPLLATRSPTVADAPIAGGFNEPMTSTPIGLSPTVIPSITNVLVKDTESDWMVRPTPISTFVPKNLPPSIQEYVGKQQQQQEEEQEVIQMVNTGIVIAMLLIGLIMMAAAGYHLYRFFQTGPPKPALQEQQSDDINKKTFLGLII